MLEPRVLTTSLHAAGTETDRKPLLVRRDRNVLGDSDPIASLGDGNKHHV